MTKSEKFEDWSPTYVRVRAELFVATVLIFAVARLGISLKSIPGVQMALDVPANPGILLVFLNLVYLYLLLAFCLRRRAENYVSAVPIAIFKPLEESLRNIVVGWRSVIEARPPNFTDEAMHAHLLRLVRDEESIKRLLDQIQQMAVGQPQDFAALETEWANRGYGAPISEFLKLMKEAPLLPGELARAVENHGPLIRDQMFRFFTQFDEKLIESKSFMEKQVAEFDKLRREITTMRTEISLERNVVGFWLPLSFSISLVLLSLPQSIVDIAPLALKAALCISTADTACLFRGP